MLARMMTITTSTTDRRSQLLTTRDFARLLRCHPITIHRSRRSGRLFGLPTPEHLKFPGGQIRYRTEAVQAYIDQLRDRGYHVRDVEPQLDARARPVGR